MCIDGVIRVVAMGALAVAEGRRCPVRPSCALGMRQETLRHCADTSVEVDGTA